jgi:glutamate/tyrosine decarboxylase-like PLP-dependent enzyme
VDAAYGGFFTLLPELPSAAAYTAIGACDSVVVDPHKHGLQPYGCGAVLFADPSVGRLYKHDSPYTYFTSDELHLGEISLECSRAGASAAALWLTFQVLPPTVDGLGAVLAAGRRAAVQLASLVASSPLLELYQEPELDIVTYLPRRGSLSEVDSASAALLARGMRERQIFLSTLRADTDSFVQRGFRHQIDASGARILRSVLMKPESEHWTEELYRRLEALCEADHG